ncbi:MAG: molybdenum cofactor guanylyltransferase MobA [Xanthomonadales bacterium]|nr:molybdenum cofactor guanylyltransferase MobA [Xanthomonadales bacterium]
MAKPVGVILAGGRSRRMGGVNKALQDLAGKPLLSHVITRMQPQCSSLYLSVEAIDPVWERFGLPQVADMQAGSNGPLGGVLAALEAIKQPSDWLLLVPCDAPFLPLELAERLSQHAQQEQALSALISYQDQWQPTFSLWHTDLLPALRIAVEQEGQRGLKEFLSTQSPAVLDWPTQQPSPFFNINSPEDLAATAALLDQQAMPIS